MPMDRKRGNMGAYATAFNGGLRYATDLPLIVSLCNTLRLDIGDLSAYDREQKVRDQGPQAVYVREEKIRAKVVVSAVGGLVEPNLWPKDIPGMDKFEGQMFHSARWRYDVDLRDKDVIVVGTGCSAAQFVPELVTEYGAKSVTQLMRSPPWVVPRKVPPMGEENWAKWSPWLSKNVPGFGLAIRYLIGLVSEYDWRLFCIGEWYEKERKRLEQSLLKNMQQTVPRKYHEILTPNYSVACMSISNPHDIGTTFQRNHLLIS
jgi:cation diffusion facilitator CzcD-associated flavoprotein CzcO